MGMRKILVTLAMAVASPAAAGIYLPYPEATVSYTLTGVECPVGSTMDAPGFFQVPYAGLDIKLPHVESDPPLGCRWQGIPACTWSCVPHWPPVLDCTEVCPHVLDCELTPSGPFSLRLVTDFYLLQGALIVDYDGCVALYDADVELP